MNDILDLLWYVLKCAVVYISCFALAILFCRRVMYSKEKKNYLIFIVTNAICFIFFLAYGLLANHYYIRAKFFAPLWFFLFPLSLVLLLVFLYLFFTTNDKKVNHIE
jgi:hypothetical protein